MARSSRRDPVFGDPIGSDHDAAMRIGREAPGRRAHGVVRLTENDIELPGAGVEFTPRQQLPQDRARCQCNLRKL